MLPNRLTFHIPQCSNSILLFLFILLLLPGKGFCQDLSATDNASFDATSIFSPQYTSAKDYFYNLERDPLTGNERSNWLTGIRNFRRIYLADTTGDLAPSCLYMMGRMYWRMYRHFKLPLDLEEAVSYFNDVVSIFPRSSLADDALFNIAEIELNDRNAPERAAEIYQKVLKRFPDGDKKGQSINRLKRLAQTQDITLPGQLKSQETTGKLVNVLPVQYWSSKDYTRVVIRASAPVHYKTSLLEKNDNQPRRLYIDFSQSYTPPKFRSPVPIDDGLLKQVRTGQFNDTTVRVVLDIESISDYTVFSLKDPFRVVVDVRGVPEEEMAATKEQKEPESQLVPENHPKTAELKTDIAPEFQQEVFITLADRKKISAEDSTAEMAETKGLSLSLAQQLGLGVRRIVIDPGHGGKDPGAMAFGLKEKDIVLNVAHRIAAVLREQHGYEVIMTRNKDVFLPLEERTAIANTNSADLFLSIHVNAHPQKSATGIETFFLNLATNSEAMRVAALENATSTHNISEMQNILTDLMQNEKINESSQLAEFVQDSLINGLEEHEYNIKDLGVKQAPFYVLIGAEMPAILAEISFISNPQEAQLLKESSYLQAIAERIADGVVTYVEQRRSAALQL